MPKTILTSDQIEFIKAHRLEMSGSGMARRFGVNKAVVNSYMFNNGLAVSAELKIQFRVKALTGKTTSTPEMDEFLKKHYLTTPVKRMAEMINKSGMFVWKRLEQLRLIQPPELIAKFKKDSQIKKGNIPFNKGKKQSEYMSREAIERTIATRFKKGGIAPNKINFKDGDITLRYDKLKDGSFRPYKWIRIAKAKWKMLHVVNWEKVHGPVPEGYIIVFKDGDSTKCEEGNLEMITLAENMIRNTIHRYPDEIKEVIMARVALNKKIHKRIKETVQ